MRLVRLLAVFALFAFPFAACDCDSGYVTGPEDAAPTAAPVE